MCQLLMLWLVDGWNTVIHFSGAFIRPVSIDYSQSKIVLFELSQICVDTLVQHRYAGNSIGSLFSFVQSSNWLPWSTSLYMLVSLNISLYIYQHTALLKILDVVRVLPISSMYQNFNLLFTKQFGFSLAFDAPTVWNSHRLWGLGISDVIFGS